jgi:protein-S-isoprenylcysteine O-methyltransferase Ste14
MSVKAFFETKIPPPVYGLITALVIWGTAKLLPSLSLMHPPYTWLGVVLIVIGVGIDLTALAHFYAHKTTFNPFYPDRADKLVIFGIYRYSRNPMYLGLLLSLTGWAFYLGNLAGFVWLPIFVRLMNWMQIMPEEQALVRKFGEPYMNYLQRVRRWL